MTMFLGAGWVFEGAEVMGYLKVIAERQDGKTMTVLDVDTLVS